MPFQHSTTLTVLPWVPASEVERVYRNIQQQVLREKPRESGLRILEVAQFVTERVRMDGTRNAWEQWFHEWNRSYPDKQFKTWRHFREYGDRGYKKALPTYLFPEPKPTPEKQEEMDERFQRLTTSLEAHIKKHGNRWPKDDEA